MGWEIRAEAEIEASPESVWDVSLDGGRTRFVQSERLDGILAGVLERSIRDHTLAGFG